MSFERYTFVPARDIPYMITGAFILCLGFLGYVKPDIANQYANLILVGVTAVYVHVTYELLRQTRNNKNLPYVGVEFLIASDLRGDFFQSYEKYVEQTPEFLTVRADANSANSTPKNIVFVKVQNTGESVAIAPELELKYSRKNFLDEDRDREKRVTFKDLQIRDTSIKMLEVYEHPTSADYLEISKSKVWFKDIGRYHTGESPIKTDFSKRTSHLRDDNVSIVFRIV